VILFHGKFGNNSCKKYGMKKNYLTTKLNPISQNKSRISSLFLCAFLLFINFLNAQSQGPQYPATDGTVNGAGTAWTNTGRIVSDNNSYSTSNLAANASSEYLYGTNFNFTIPGTATITGIIVTIGRYSNGASGTSIRDTNVRLIKANTIDPNANRADLVTDWPFTEVAQTYGSATDMWGTTWTPAQINSTQFGVALSAQAGGTARVANVDYMRITVCYTLPPTITALSPANTCLGTTPVVTITGTNFTGVTDVQYNNVSVGAGNFTFVTATQITFTLPAGAPSGVGVVKVVTPGGSATSNFTVNSAPAITAQPASISRCTATGATFSVTATGTGLIYQWYKNGSTITGATGASYTIPSVVIGDAATYHCVVTGSCSPSAVSNNATLTVTQGVSITGQPATPQSICTGSSATFTTTATGAISGYEWYKVGNATPLADGGNISGATTFQLTLNPIIAGTAGSYYCVVKGTSPCGNVTSNNSVLTVNSLPSISAQPVSLSRCSGTNASFSVTATGTGITYKWYKDLSATPLANGGNIAGATTNTLTLTAVTLANAGNYHCEVTGTCLPVAVSNDATLTVTQAVSITTQPATTQSICAGSSATFTTTATGAISGYEWYKVGNATPLADGGNISGAATFQLTLNPIIAANAGSYYCIVKGTSPCGNVTSNNSALTVNSLPSITAQPVSLSRCTGTTASFSITASGTGITYKWYKDLNPTPLANAGNISGATTNTLTLTAVTLANAGNYHCEVTGTCLPIAVSNDATLTVTQAISITGQPIVSQSICAGSSATITTTATGAISAYEWYKVGNATPLADGGNISGATTFELTLNPVIAANAGSYYCIVKGTGPCGNIMSNNSVLTVNSLPAITAQPAPQIICSGTNVSFSVTATGTGITYKWYYGATLLNNGANISGATTNTISLGSITLANAGNYHCEVSGTCLPTAVSNDALLTVIEAIALTGQPLATQSLCTGNNAIFSVTATGAVSAYEWYKSGNPVPLADGGNISGAATFQLTLSALALTDAGNYYCIVKGTNPCGNVTSNNSTLIVNEGPAITANPTSTQTVCSGTLVSLSITATGGSLTFKWYKGATLLSDGGNLSGTATATLTINPSVPADSAIDYHCVVSNGCVIPVISNNAELIVNETPFLFAYTPTICSEGTFTVIPANGIPTAATIIPANTTYSWAAPVVTGGITGGNADSGQTQISQTLTNPTNAVQTATYTVFPTSGTTGSCVGAPFTITVTVNPMPFINNLSPGTCSGQTLTITPTNGGGNIVPVGTTYSWGAPVVSGGMTGGTAGSGTSISANLNNLTNTLQTASYNVTATSGSCVGSTFTIGVKVNPKPTVLGTPATLSPICSGGSIAPITLSNPNNVAGTIDYNWTRSNTVNLTGMASGGNGSVISGNLTNSTGSPQTAVFTLTATSDEGCVSDPVTVSVVVNPIPSVAALPATQTICSGDNATINLSNPNNVPGTILSWTRDNTAFITGIPDGSGATISGTLTNSTLLPQTTTFTITATANGCSSVINTISVIVNPRPDAAITPNATQTICAETAFAAMTISNSNGLAGTTFSWTRSNTTNLTGYANSGTGTSIPAGSFINQTNTNQTTTFTVTAATGSCSSVGPAVTVDIVVKPSPLITATPASQNVCNGGTISTINLGTSNNVTGTVYSWTRDNTTNLTGMAASGSGATITGNLTNNQASAQTATFTITALAPNGCTSTKTVTVTVYAQLTVPVIGNAQTVCVLSTPAALFISTPSTGGSGIYTYQWQRSGDNVTFTNIAGATGLTYQPPFVNLGDNDVFFRLVVTNICGSTTSTSVFVEVVSNVGFSFGVDDGLSGAICPGSTFTPTINSIHFFTSAVRFAWTADSNYITPATGGPVGTTGGVFIIVRTSSASIGPLTAQNNTNATVITPVSITPSVYNYPGPPSGSFICSVTPQIINVTIYPKPVATATVANTTICSGTSTAIQVLSNITDANTNYTWTRDNGTVSSGNVRGAASGSGSGSSVSAFLISNILTNTTASEQNVTYSIIPTSNGCTGAMITIVIKVAPLLTAGVVGTSQTICSGSTVTLTETSAASSALYQWQYSINGVNYFDISGANAATYTSGPLTQNTWFVRVASQASSITCSVATSPPILITINNITAGSITTDKTICNGGNPGILGDTANGSVNATGSGTITYEWESSTNGCGGPWTPIAGAFSATYSPGALSGTISYHRRAKSVFNTISCYSAYSNCITITINAVSGGTIGSDQGICGNNPAAFTELTPSTGLGILTYQWQISSDNITYTNIAFATSATYDPPAGVIAVTYYQRVTISTLNGVSCTALSNHVTVSPNAVTPGTISSNRTVCYGGDPAAFTVAVAATGTSLTYQWQHSTIGGAGPWTDITGAVNDTYDEPGPITQTTYFQRIATATIGSGCSVASNFVTVFVNDVTASVISGDQVVCGVEDPTAFTINTAATGNGVVSYQWQSSTSGCSGPWINIGGATGATYDPPVPVQTMYYHVVVTSTLNSVLCTAIGNCITIISNSRVWTGLVNNDWNIAGNWSSNSVPTASNCVVIPNVATDPHISGSSVQAEAYNLTILNGGVLEIDTTNGLTLTDIVNVNPGGQFLIRDDADLVQINNVNNIGIVNVERITPPVYRFDYTYWSSPLTLASNFKLGGVGGLSPATQPDKYYSWTPTIGNSFGGWAQESAATIMDPRKGYIVRAPQTYSNDPGVKIPYTANFIGTPNNGDILAPVYHGTLLSPNNNDKYNLLGNPYPSGLDADKFVNDPANTPVIDGTIYFWTHNSPPSPSYVDPFYGDFVINYTATDYATWNLLGSTAATTGGVAPGGFIASGQGFFTRSTGTAPSGDPVTFKNTMRTPGKNSQFFRDANIPQAIEKHRIWLNMINNSGAFNQILVGYATGATEGWDRNFDGVRISDVGSVFYSTIPDQNLVIQGRPLPFDVEDKVALGYKAATAGTYAIRIDHIDGLFDGQNIYIEDKLLNTIHDIKQSPYVFTSATGTFNDRLVLRYTNAFLGNNNFNATSGLIALISDQKLLIQSSQDIREVYVYDITGKLIRKYVPENLSKNFEAGFVFADGMYIIKVKLEDSTIVTEKLINSK
jgi:hypothetical protein